MFLIFLTTLLIELLITMVTILLFLLTEVLLHKNSSSIPGSWSYNANGGNEILSFSFSQNILEELENDWTVIEFSEILYD